MTGNKSSTQGTARMSSPNDSTLNARLDNLSLQGSSRGVTFGLRSKGSGRPSRRSQEYKRMLWGVSDLISDIYAECSEAQDKTSGPVTIKEYEPVASYNWKDNEHPTIYVPGMPPKFTPPTLPIQLGSDNLKRSKPRSPAAPVDPLFQAILHEHPDFDMSHIQLVTTRNSLRDLLTFASGRIDQWRMDVDIVHGTMFFNQWEEFRLSFINGRPNPGYGHAFENCASTQEPPLEDSLHHERIVKYELGGLKLLVRYEADAYLDEANDDKSKEGLVIPPSDVPAPAFSPTILKPPYKLVHLISCGRSIKSDTIVELKSCARGAFNSGKVLPQLWFSQTRHLCVGYHKEGLLTKDLEMKDMTEEVKKWEDNNQQHLKNMVRVIGKIRDIAMTAQRITVICSKDAGGVMCLSVYHRKAPGMVIRPEVLARCWRNMAGS